MACSSGSLFQNALGYITTWENIAHQGEMTDGWIIGYDRQSSAPPWSIMEGSLLHALLRVENHLDQNYTPVPPCVEVKAGNQDTQQALLDWIHRRDLKLQSG